MASSHNNQVDLDTAFLSGECFSVEQKKITKSCNPGWSGDSQSLNEVQEDMILLHSYEGEDGHEPLHLPVRQHRTSN